MSIIVPLDGSELSGEVLPYVQTLAPLLNVPVHLLRAIPDAPSDEMRQPAEAYLAQQAQALQQAGLEVSTEVVFQSPPLAIVETATQKEATLIAMATHGYSGLRRWAVGSVTDEVVHTTTTVPVFVVRSSGEEGGPPPFHIKRILLPLDGSELAQKSLPCATLLAKQTQAEILLVRAIFPLREFYEGLQPVPIPQAQYEATLQQEEALALEHLQGVAESLHEQGILVNTVVQEGRAAEVLIDVAEQRDVDLIVMSTHGYGGLDRLLVGSVADKVLHATTTPLVLVHAKG